MQNNLCICPNNVSLNQNTYVNFDVKSTEELTRKITANQIINRSLCTNIPLGYLSNDPDDKITINDILARFRNEVGVYHLWVKEDDCCPVHKTYSLRCLYVGKGEVFVRAKEHISEKWLDPSQFYISFFKCENRIAKYLEQLFLDTYKFEMNKIENSGVDTLYAYWDEYRYTVGTETSFVADKYAMNQTKLYSEK